MKKTFTLMVMMLMAATMFAQTRSALLHMKDGSIKEFNYEDLERITFTNPVTYDLDVECTYTNMNIYYGSGMYLVHISNGPISDNGLPTEAGQQVFRFYLFADEPVDPRNAILPAGRYTMEDGQLYKDRAYTCALICEGIDSDGNPEGGMIGFDSAVLNVEYFTNGTYKIEIKGHLSDEYAEDYGDARGVFTGKMSFDCKDPNVYDYPASDITLKPNYLTGNYTVWDSGVGDFNIVAFNCVVDDDFYIVGPGELFGMELLNGSGSPMNLDDLVGEYTMQSADEWLAGQGTAGHFIEGTLYEYYGMMMSLGTYYNTYDEGGAEGRVKAMATGGSVKVTKENGLYVFDVDLEIEGGHRLTMNYSTDGSMIADYSAAREKGRAPASVQQQKNGGMAPAKPRANVMQPRQALRFMKKG